MDLLSNLHLCDCCACYCYFSQNFRIGNSKMNNDNINDYVPSLLNPRVVRKAADLSLTQNSILSRCSLSLKRRNDSPSGHKISNNVTQSHKHERLTKKDGVLQHLQNNTNKVEIEKKLNSPTGEKSIILVTNKEKISPNTPNKTTGKENKHDSPKFTPAKLACKHSQHKATIDDLSLGSSAIEDLSVRNNENSSLSFGEIEIEIKKQLVEENNNGSLITVSSATDLVDDTLNDSSSTIKYDLTEVPVISVSFGVHECEKVDLSTKNTSIKKVLVTHKENTTNIDCELLQNSQILSLTDSGSRPDENMNEVQHSPLKRSAIGVNLEIKKKKLSPDANEVNDSNILILKTEDIAKLTHVIVQPPNYKLVKKQILRKNSKRKSCINNGRSVPVGDGLKQERIDSYFRKSVDVVNGTLVKVSGEDKSKDVDCEGGAVMSKNLGVVDIQGAKFAGQRREEASPRSSKLRARESHSSRAALRSSQTDARRVASAKHDSGSSNSPRRQGQADSLHFSLTTKTKSVKSTVSPRHIPHYKIVAGTHFAVDAFSYGDIPNVKYYFLTHFHSDHYAGLKKSFNKFLFCSKITAELCMTRLGVNSKSIHVIDSDETFTVDGVEVTAVDANHCPGAIMLVFSLPNGKTLLHTGDFRAAPAMESYPVFWNKDINTIYLDTTYCNPRYDFPTQDQSLEMALYILRQKKMLLEKSGKKFSSVLIVCGTYTIGKEKFFLGMARRVGCSVWACPEKDRVLRAVEGRSFSHAPAHSCQLHVVPMRDLTHEKLRTYLDSLNGAFSEVVAFKPSGWENGKNSAVEKDGVSIHGVPYSEHSSFSELIRFVKFLKPRQVVPTVDISGGAKAVQKYFPCPIVCQEELLHQTKLTDCFSIQSRPQGSAVT